MKVLRCAVYTRKSTEDGLEQEFNSLHAQREACEAYILSQRHEGWTLVPAAYDDGGFSGGNMERPGLKALMAEVDAGLVDVIVVYKVDRLTRSLADFAKIVERLDAKQASFVSVTQAFNTTSSMGRLTLNVLLSFAQFEREVTGERIRDKIAASKKKGLWMGGPVPLGYEVRDRKLVVDPQEAERVRTIMRRYLEIQSVPALIEVLRAEGVRTKVQVRSSGRTAAASRLHAAACSTCSRTRSTGARSSTRGRSMMASTSRSLTRHSGLRSRSNLPARLRRVSVPATIRKRRSCVVC
jgi:site-specific DNA recombinase